MRSLVLVTTILGCAMSIEAIGVPQALNTPPAQQLLQHQEQQHIGLIPQDQHQDVELKPSLDLDPCALADSPSLNASMQLSSWLECRVNAFYPYPSNPSWPTAHSATFSPSLLFSFNSTHYDYSGSLALYKSFNATLGASFSTFKHGFINILGVPDQDGSRGGFVYSIGWAGGWHRRLKREVWYTNASFARIKEEGGKRRIVEFRESSNIPNSAGVPEGRGWGCSVDKEEGLEMQEGSSALSSR